MVEHGVFGLCRIEEVGPGRFQVKTAPTQWREKFGLTPDEMERFLAQSDRVFTTAQERLCFDIPRAEPSLFPDDSDDLPVQTISQMRVRKRKKGPTPLDIAHRIKIGQRLKSLRIDAGHPQHALASFINTHQTDISQLERGTAKLNPKTIKDFAAFYNKTYEWAMGDENTQNQTKTLEAGHV
jgi:ribosome-binding protein aMBF1 (putative translation factor)